MLSLTDLAKNKLPEPGLFGGSNPIIFAGEAAAKKSQDLLPVAIWGGLLALMGFRSLNLDFVMQPGGQKGQ